MSEATPEELFTVEHEAIMAALESDEYRYFDSQDRQDIARLAGRLALYDKGKSDGAARLAHLEEAARILRSRFFIVDDVRHGRFARARSYREVSKADLLEWLEADKKESE